MSSRCSNAVVVGAVVVGGLVALPVIAAPAAPAPMSGAIPNIDACVARLDPQLDIGYDRIAARCPDLMRQLETGAWAPWLPRGWKEPGNDLSVGSLKEFRELVVRESTPREPNLVRLPDVRSLKPILAELAGTRGDSGWSRFKSWLHSVFEQREQSTDESWLARMVAHIGVSQSIIQMIIYAALAAVVVLAGLIVVNELRTAGLFNKRRDAARGRYAQAEGGTPVGSWSDIEQSPLRDRPRLLLELIVRRLTDRGYLPPSGALTVRELIRAAQLPDSGDRSRLADIAVAAERVCYSAVGAQAAVLVEPIARGQELLTRLDAGAEGARRSATVLDASLSE